MGAQRTLRDGPRVCHPFAPMVRRPRLCCVRPYSRGVGDVRARARRDASPRRDTRDERPSGAPPRHPRRPAVFVSPEASHATQKSARCATWPLQLHISRVTSVTRTAVQSKRHRHDLHRRLHRLLHRVHPRRTRARLRARRRPRMRPRQRAPRVQASHRQDEGDRGRDRLRRE